MFCPVCTTDPGGGAESQDGQYSPPIQRATGQLFIIKEAREIDSASRERILSIRLWELGCIYVVRLVVWCLWQRSFLIKMSSWMTET